MRMKKPHLFVIGLLLIVLFITAAGGENGRQNKPKTDSITLPSSSLKVDADFGRMPLYFIPNKGQLDEQVSYYVQGKDKTLYFTSAGITFSLAGPSEERENRSASNRKIVWPQDPREPAEKTADVAERWTVKLDFVGADKNVRPVGVTETEAIVSYFKGTPDQWHTGLPTFSRIVYRDLWPGIDLVFRGTVNKLKYEFIVHPGADPSIIRLAYRGAESVSVDENGRLQVTTPLAGFSDDVPVAYQKVGGESTDISIAYKLIKSNIVTTPDEHLEGDPEIEEFFYGFEIGDYDRSLPVVLDPTILAYCGYIGGSGWEGGGGIAVDGTGNVYVTGGTDSGEASFPVTVGPDLTYNGGTWDAFVAKVNSSGTALVYCGYIGGSSTESGYGIAVDGSGNAYVTGDTESTEATFPVIVGPDLIYNGGDGDAFVAKVNSSGTALVYCGYIGGNSMDWGSGIAVDGSGNAYVTGTTSSTKPTFPETVGPDLGYNGGWDGYVAKINSSGTALVYCGYIGGSGGDYGAGIAVDGSGNAYVTGFADSTEATFPVVIGPDLSHNSRFDAFLAKVNSSGTALVYCGYVGGDLEDYGEGIAVDGSGNAYVTGTTSSTEATFPVTVGPDLIYNGAEDAFVAKVNSSGTALVYCGYIGGSGDDGGDSIVVDGSGNAYVTGYTGSTETTFPETVGPDLSYNGSRDAFVAKVSYWDIYTSKHARGDFDGDGAGEAVVDFGTVGIFLYNGGSWMQLSCANPEGLMAADVDGDSVAELLADMGPIGLWLWNAGAWNQLSGLNVERMAAGDVDADGAEEVVGDFGTVGLWLYNGGTWSQLSGVNADYVDCANLDGSGGEEIIGDFGSIGLWIWNTGAWTQLSGANADYMAFGDADGLPGEELVGDFGSIGLWLWSQTGGWTQLSGVNADYLVRVQADGDAAAEFVGDFGALGLWIWNGGIWDQLSGADAEFMVGVDSDGNGTDEGGVDFGPLGLWLGDFTAGWTQLSGVNPEYLMAGDFDGDSANELMADFGALGLWLWNGGVWSQISVNNPD